MGLAATSAMSVVIVTGCNGFIGRATARALASEHEVIGLDDNAPKLLGPLTELVPVDFKDDASVAAGLAHIAGRYGRRLASVIHLAAYYDFSGEPSPLYERVTIRGTERLLKNLEALEVEQFVFSSTMLVHGPTVPGSPIRETSPVEPKWDYPKSKWETEELIRKRGASLRSVILRIAGVYDDGCHSPPLANQIQRIYERKLISHVFPGDLSHGQAFIALEDVVGAFEQLVARRAQLPPGETLLIGEPETLSYGELQHQFARLIHGEEWTTDSIPKAIAKAGAWLEQHVPGEEPFIKPWMIDIADDHFELDISRAREQLRWNPKRNLRAALPRMIEELRSDPRAWYLENKLELPHWLENEATNTPTEHISPV
jgi:nucleoside-diphosphate-sugar epimerase